MRGRREACLSPDVAWEGESLDRAELTLPGGWAASGGCMNPAPSDTTIRIRPSAGWRALQLSEAWAYRDVLVVLALRDIKLRYRQTALGVVWVVLQPLLAGAIFATIFGHFAKLPSGGRPYLLFVFAGLMGWNLFAAVVQRAGMSLVAESRLITKVYFPRLLVPLAAAGAALLDFAVSLLVMAVLLAWHGAWPGGWLVLLPLAVVLNLALAIGLGLWVAALNVRYRDFMYVLPFMLQVLMYASPVVYGLELVPDRWRTLFMLNPMVGVMEATRAAFLGWRPDVAGAVWIAVASGGAILASGLMFFRRVERTFADTL